MNFSLKAGLALAAFGLVAVPHSALAQRIVLSGDSNIGNPLDGSFGPGIDPGNQRFFQNVLGSGTQVVQENGDSTGSGGLAETSINNFYNGLPGVTATVVSGPITASTLAGANLFIDVLPTAALTGSEISALQTFFSGGGTIFFLGENSYPDFMVSNASINSALSALGSSLQIVPDNIDGGNFSRLRGRILLLIP